MARWAQEVLEYVNLPVLKRMASQLGLRGVSSARKAVVVNALRETLPYTPLSVVIGFQEQLPPDKLQYAPELPPHGTRRAALTLAQLCRMLAEGGVAANRLCTDAVLRRRQHGAGGAIVSAASTPARPPAARPPPARPPEYMLGPGNDALAAAAVRSGAQPPVYGGVRPSYFPPAMAIRSQPMPPAPPVSLNDAVFQSTPFYRTVKPITPPRSLVYGRAEFSFTIEPTDLAHLSKTPDSKYRLRLASARLSYPIRNPLTIDFPRPTHLSIEGRAVPLVRSRRG